MPQYTSPGVYVEEVLPSARSIAGVGTSTAGLVGVVPDDATLPDGATLADAKTPVLVTNWEEFKKNFGDFQEENETLAHAVYGFFNNGGTRCWVMRIASAETDDGTGTAIPDPDFANPQTLLDEKFGPIDEIAIVAFPGATSATQHQALTTHCAKKEDRFAILDGRSDGDVGNPSSIGPGKSANGTYAAVYFPQIQVFDPLHPGTPYDAYPSGHIAGIYARSDASRGVHKAPGNEGIRGALGVTVPVDQAKQGPLNEVGINIIRSFRGVVKIWGVRTLSDNSTTKHINVRRFLNFLRESIDGGTQFVVFEPNSPALWQQITRTVRGFLLNQWRDGALFGTKPEQAFYVKCDEETNPAELRELGQVVTEIGVSIVRPAEFVIFRVQQMTNGG